MSKNLGRDFSRLAKSSNPIDPRAPWWVNWLMQLAIGLFGLWLIATAADWLWVKLTGQPLGLWCQAVALIPWDLALSVGMVMLLIGAILAVSSASRTTGIVWLILGSLIYTIPELVPEFGPLRGCNF